jgi:replicative DNA helicase
MSRQFGKEKPAELDRFYCDESERAVIGACLAFGRDAIRAAEGAGLVAEHMYREHHRWHWRALQALDAEGVTPEPLLVSYRTRDLCGDVLPNGDNGTLYLVRAAAEVVTDTNVGYYAGIVRDFAERREVLALLRQAAIDLKDPNSTTAAIRESVQSAWPESKGMMSAVSVVDAVRERIATHERESDRPTPKIPTTMPTLNQWWGGWGQNWLVYIGGRPGMGKTSYATQEALGAAMAGIPTLFVTIEMTRAQLVDRMIGTLGGPGVEEVQRGLTTSAQWDRLIERSAELAEYPIWIEDAGQTIDALASRVRYMVERHAVRLVVIDYVQLIKAGGSVSRNAQKNQHIAAVSNGLAALKKALPITILAAAQLNRNGPDRPPILADLKESGDLEQDADVVVFPYRPGFGKKDADQTASELIVAKNRHGRYGVVQTKWEGALTKYTEIKPDVEYVGAPTNARWADDEE